MKPTAYASLHSTEWYLLRELHVFKLVAVGCVLQYCSSARGTLAVRFVSVLEVMRMALFYFVETVPISCTATCLGHSIIVLFSCVYVHLRLLSVVSSTCFFLSLSLDCNAGGGKAETAGVVERGGSKHLAPPDWARARIMAGLPADLCAPVPVAGLWDGRGLR